jgi:hypothetical protein
VCVSVCTGEIYLKEKVLNSKKCEFDIHMIKRAI